MKSHVKKILMVVACVLFIILGVFLTFVIPIIGETVYDWGANEVLATVTIIGVFVTIIVPFLNNMLKAKKDKETHAFVKNLLEIYSAPKTKKEIFRIDIHVSVLEKNMVLFSACIENIGNNKITTKVSNLYIDQGIPAEMGSKVNVSGMNTSGAVCYEFPFILEHVKDSDKGIPDCILCTRCKENMLVYPAEHLKGRFQNSDLYHGNIELQHLSVKSIQYIYPGEKFSEDVIMQFKNEGVYRVTFIVTADGEADCSCATKQFFIPAPLKAKE